MSHFCGMATLCLPKSVSSDPFPHPNPKPYPKVGWYRRTIPQGRAGCKGELQKTQLDRAWDAPGGAILERDETTLPWVPLHGDAWWKTTPGNTFLPAGEVTAHLQPFLKPGSTPNTTRPRTGGISNNRFRFEMKISMLAFSAVFFRSDLIQTKQFFWSS